jgi:hypothetical protein
MFALLEVNNADFGPLYESREEAQAALEEIRMRIPEEEAEGFDVVELDGDGFPVGEPAPMGAVTH